MESLGIILDYNGVDPPEQERQILADEKNGYYTDLLSQLGRDDMISGSLEFVREASEAGHRLAVASSSKNAETVLAALNIEQLFQTVVTGHDIVRTKPDPQIFQVAADRLGVSPESCIVFEDAESGIAAAKAAGMCAVFVAPAESDPPADLPADAVIHGFNGVKLDELLGRLAV